jgi:hypothetical protein
MNGVPAYNKFVDLSHPTGRGWRATLLAAVLLGLSGASCARDVNGANPLKPYPNQVILSFRTADTLDPNLWYYFVFNSTETSTDPAQAPFNIIDYADQDRGLNWQRYVAYHPASNGAPEKWLTAQRAPSATVIPVAAGPTDAVAGDLAGNGLADIAVACEGAGVVQLIVEQTALNTTNPIYYGDPVTVYTGVAPRFVFAGDFTNDGKNDLLVVDAGNATSAPSVVVLAGNGDATFSPGTPLALGGTPVDALLADFTGDNVPDLALLENGPGGQHNLVVLRNAGGGSFLQAGATALSASPVAFAAGELNGDAREDVAVGLATAGGSNAVQVYDGNGSGGFTAGDGRSVPGPLRGIAVHDLDGSLDDIVVSYGADASSGAVGAFVRNNANKGLTSSITSQPLGAVAGYTIAEDFGNDGRGDALVLNGDATSGNQLTIMRGDELVNPNNPLLSSFIFSTETPITYLTGQGPVRIKPAKLNGDAIDDLLCVDAAPGATGQSVALFFGLGKYNFTNDDIYWTNGIRADASAVQDLTVQSWCLAHQTGPNTVTITIDPALFYDLAQQEPDPDGGFYVQFMVGTTSGDVTDQLQTPVFVPMIPGTTNDEIQTPLAKQTIAPIPSQDIDFWSIEVD